VCRYNWHSAVSLGRPFPVLKYQYICQIKYTEAILSDSTRKLLWFEITKIADCSLRKNGCYNFRHTRSALPLRCGSKQSGAVALVRFWETAQRGVCLALLAAGGRPACLHTRRQARVWINQTIVVHGHARPLPPSVSEVVNPAVYREPFISAWLCMCDCTISAQRCSSFALSMFLSEVGRNWCR